MMQKVLRVVQAALLMVVASLLVRRAATVALLIAVTGVPGISSAQTERLSAFSFQCYGALGAPASQLRATATLERYKVVNGLTVLDKRTYKDVNMDCTPGVNGGYQQNILPVFLATDGRVVAIDGKVYTRTATSLTVVHTFHSGNNYAQGSFIAMPERSTTESGEVHYLISIPNVSFEP